MSAPIVSLLPAFREKAWTSSEAQLSVREYLRSKSDPYALIACQTGELYARQDGERWEYPAYVVTREIDGITITREARFAYCDSQVHAPVQSRSAA